MGKLAKEYQEIKNIFKKNKLKKSLILIITSNSSPHKIAMGAAIGLFLSVMPSFTIGMWIALCIAWIKKYNLTSTYFGTWIVNPFTAGFIYFFDYYVGSLILGERIASSFLITTSTIKDVAIQVYVGGFIVALLSSLILYVILYVAASMYQKKEIL